MHLLRAFEARKPSLAKELNSLIEADIPLLVDTALRQLKQSYLCYQCTKDTKLVLSVLQQWLINYMYKRLMQLMTPEALVSNHEEIPSYYITHYLNCQSHFSLKHLLQKCYANIKEYNLARYNTLCLESVNVCPCIA